MRKQEERVGKEKEKLHMDEGHRRVIKDKREKVVVKFRNNVGRTCRNYPGHQGLFCCMAAFSGLCPIGSVEDIISSQFLPFCLYNIMKQKMDGNSIVDC